MDSDDERPVWKIILSGLLTIFFVVKLIYTCSGYKTNAINVKPNNLMNVNIPIDRENIQNVHERISNNILYTVYKSLDSFPSTTKESYGILKLKKDTLVYIGLKTTIKVPKTFYFQNNHDDSLRMAFKSPDNLNVFIHDFDTKDEVSNNFKILKTYSDLQNFKIEKTIGDITMISYKISQNKKKYNGYALCLKSDDYQTFFQFESNKLPKDKLKLSAIEFLLKNIKEKK